MRIYLFTILTLILFCSCGNERIEKESDIEQYSKSVATGSGKYIIAYNGDKYVKDDVNILLKELSKEEQSLKNEMSIVSNNFQLRIYNIPKEAGTSRIITVGNKSGAQKERGDLMIEFNYKRRDLIIQGGTLTRFNNDIILLDAFADDFPLKVEIHW
ncbi:MAG: hypothetical protein N4A37_07505 [Prolixibacteraceae bacterium]|jgi:hypothetical protein|nr:hypothetical protein [Prolixibacteraceae bacterium]